MDPLELFMGGAMIMMAFSLLMGLAMYIYGAFAFMTIAKRVNEEPAWLAWIPIANLYLATKVAQVPWWYMLAFLLTVIPVVGQLAFMGVMIYLAWKTCERLGKPGWWGVLFIIPLVNLVILGVLAWGKD